MPSLGPSPNGYTSRLHEPTLPTIAYSQTPLDSFIHLTHNTLGIHSTLGIPSTLSYLKSRHSAYSRRGGPRLLAEIFLLSPRPPRLLSGIFYPVSNQAARYTHAKRPHSNAPFVRVFEHFHLKYSFLRSQTLHIYISYIFFA